MTDRLPEQDARGPIAWMARNPVAANLVMFVCLLGGILFLHNIKKEVFPDIELDIVEVFVSYPGATPEDVEKGIILPVEEAVQDLEGVKEITSTAREGAGTVMIEVLDGADPQQVAQDVKNEVDRITSFPEDAEEPQVRLVEHKRGVLSVVLYGDAERVVLHELAEQIRDLLLQDPRISRVDVEGVPALEIGIEISQENLRRYGLTLGDVAARLKQASVDLPGGQLKTRNGEILVRVKERRDYGRQFARLPIITSRDGSRVFLGDIATIKDAFEESDRYTKYNGQPAVMLEVYRVGKQTPTEVADAVKRQLEVIKPELPPGIQLAIFHDRADIYRQRVRLLLKNGAMGLVLVIFLLGAFLETRVAFWVMMGIPISFLGAFLFLPAAGISINMMSLFAFIIALGIVVDDAIVVGENFYRYRQEGIPPLQAAIRGTREVVVPVTFSVLTNIACFVPLYFIPGVPGKIFGMIPVVVCTVFLISLGECLFVLPAHLAHQRARPEGKGIRGWLHHRQQLFSAAFRRWVERRYAAFLAFAMRHRIVTIAVAISALVTVLSYALSGRMGFGLFPTIESDFAQASVELPYGSHVRKTEAVVERLVAGARKVLEQSGHPELVKSVICNVAPEGSHTARVMVELADADIRDKIMSTEEFVRRWRKEVGEFAGIKALIFSADFGGPGGHSRALAVELSHRDMGILEKASKELAEVLATYPRVKDVDDGFQPGKQQLDIRLRPEGKSLGLTARDIGRQVRSAFYGAEVLRQIRGRNEVKIMVRLSEKERVTEKTVYDLMIRAPAGTYVPLREIAEISWGRGYTTINRRNGRRVVQVTADVIPRSKVGEVLADLKAGVLPRLTEKYPRLSYSFEGHEAEIRESMGSLKLGSTLALLAVYMMLAIPFRSYLQPLIVMISIPFGIVGAILGHLIMGYDLALPSLFGIVALSGVVVNDSLVLIDFANRRRRESDASPHTAVHAAAVRRFRPIMLTTLTTFGGLAPMIFETSFQAKIMIPLAISLGFGLLFATLITLVMIPCFYVIAEDVRSAVSRLRPRISVRAQAVSPASIGQGSAR